MKAPSATARVRRPSEKFGSGQASTSSRIPRGLAVADGGSGSVAHAVDGGFGELAEADDQQPLGGEARRGMQEDSFIGAGFVFAGGEDGSGGGLNSRVGGESVGAGLTSGPFVVWVSTARTASSAVSMPERGPEKVESA